MQTYYAQKTVLPAGILILLVAAGCSTSEPPDVQSAAPVQTAVAERAPIHRIVAARGILYPVDQAAVAAKISAPVETLRVNRGDHVRRAQLLAVLENRDLAAAVAETKGLYEQAEAAFRNVTEASLPEEIAKAQGEVRAAEESLDAARKLYESRKELLHQGAVPQRLVDEANVAYVEARSRHEIAAEHLKALEKIGQDSQKRQAQAELDAARGRYQAAEAQLAYSKILSPIDGIVADRPIYPGEMASAGSPFLTIVDISRVIARAYVPSNQLAFLKTGAPATIAAPDSSSELEGRVTVISPALDPNSTTAEVWVEAANPGESFKPGMSIEVSITAETIEDAVVIPLTALLPSEEGDGTVFVVDGDSTAHERRIRTGVREGEKVQVLEGVEPGEHVVTVGGLGLEEEAKVTVTNMGQND